MMFRKLTMITALAAALAFPAVALAAHGGHGGGHGGGGMHGGGGGGGMHGGGVHGGGMHGGGWHGGGMAWRRLAWRWLAWRWRATILGWSLVALRRWPVLAVVLRHLELGLLARIMQRFDFSCALGCAFA